MASAPSDTSIAAPINFFMKTPTVPAHRRRKKILLHIDPKA